KHLSKFISLVLRHQPEIIQLELDQNGWADVEELIKKMQAKGKKIDRTLLEEIVLHNDKQRFTFNAKKDKIRANQGHSISVDMEFQPQRPPDILYHGTSQKSIKSIFRTGLEKRSRQHVHLSADVETATKVGQRHGKVVILEVQAGKMYDAGFAFYLSKNGVWLTEEVAVEYLVESR
ncbi:MAG: RNA 2'-phosphotransferase, partial [Bacteroidota bacterium]